MSWSNRNHPISVVRLNDGRWMAEKATNPKGGCDTVTLGVFTKLTSRVCSFGNGVTEVSQRKDEANRT